FFFLLQLVKEMLKASKRIAITFVFTIFFMIRTF
ncbi:MAG: hypothetical protein ACI8WA_001469, partial [Polaribacter sp.]